MGASDIQEISNIERLISNVEVKEAPGDTLTCWFWLVQVRHLTVKIFAKSKKNVILNEVKNLAASTPGDSSLRSE